MSFLIQQSEVNDCGVAICAMVLNQKEKEQKWSLETFKVYHHYHHEPYSFATMQTNLAKHHIEAHSYEIENLDLVRQEKQVFCLQIINEFGLTHFVLAKPVKLFSWLIFDPAKLKPVVINEAKLLTMMTGFIQIYEWTKPKKINYFVQVKFLWQLLKTNWTGFLVNNSLMVLNLFLTILVNSFLRIIFQDYLFLTLERVLILSLGLSLIICLNWSVDYLKKRLNLFWANSYFQKICQTKLWTKKFQQGLKYLFVQDLERSYYEFCQNVVCLITFINESLGFSFFLGLMLSYFYQINLYLFFSSFLLILGLAILKIFKLKKYHKEKRQLHAQQSLYFYEFKQFLNNQEGIFYKTSLVNYWKLKNLDHLYMYKATKINEKYQFIERFTIYFYYLIVCLIIPWTGSQISGLIIFTTITLVLTTQFEQLMQAGFNYEAKNYFNLCFNLNEKVSELIIPNIDQLSFKKKLIKTNFLIVSSKELKEVKVNGQNLIQDYHYSFNANLAFNLNETIYHNIFNYNEINLLIAKTINLDWWINQFNLNLELKPTKNQVELIKYLSCYFAQQNLIILNLPIISFWQQQLIQTFPNKFFIFLNDEIKN